MSHPNPTHDRSNEYPDDVIPTGRGMIARPKKHIKTSIGKNVGKWAKSLDKALNSKKK